MILNVNSSRIPSTYNLILIGGPADNNIVDWLASSGEWEYIEAVKPLVTRIIKINTEEVQARLHP